MNRTLDQLRKLIQQHGMHGRLLTTEQLQAVYDAIYGEPDAAIAATQARLKFEMPLLDFVEYMLYMRFNSGCSTFEAYLQWDEKWSQEFDEWIDAYTQMTPEERESDDTKRRMRVQAFFDNQMN